MQSAVPVTAPNYSFHVEQDGKKFTFTYKRSKYGIKLYLILAAALPIPLFLIFVMVTQSFQSALLLALAVPTVICLLLSRRRAGQFVIDPTHVHVGGKTYQRDHIQEFYYDLPKPFDNDTSYTYKYQVHQLREETRQAILKQAAAKNFIIGFVYGEKHIKLAGGLTETGAEILYKKLQAVLIESSQA